MNPNQSIYSSGSFIATFLVSPLYAASTLIMIQYIPNPIQSSHSSKPIKRRLSNSSDGYLIPNQSPSTIPPFQLIPKKRSLFEMMKDVIFMDTEGLASLWKAFPCLYLYSMCDSVLHSFLENLFLSARETQDTLDFKSLLCIYGIKGWILSCIQLVSTRMIAQTMHPKHKTYSSTLSCFFSSFSIKTYLSRPCLLGCLESSLEFIFECGSIGAFMYFGSIGRVLVQTISLITTIPIKVIRRRMELPSPSIPTVVQTSQVPFVGISDTVWRIMKQEGVSALFSTFWYRFWIMLTVEGLKSLTRVLQVSRDTMD